MKTETRQKLFDYFSQEYNLSLMDSDFNELENAFKDADGGLPYPANKPEITHKDYLVQIEDGQMETDDFNGVTWFAWGEYVIAFRELPKPYQPKQEG